MAPEQGADERRISHWLRRRGVGPDADPQPAEPAPRDPDWLDRLYADEEPETAGGPGPWWAVRKDPTPEPAPTAGDQQTPGVHVTITPTAPAHPASDSKARIRWWVLRRSTAAGVGWWIGIGPQAADALATTSPGGAVGFAIVLWIPAWWLATRLLRLVPAAAIDEVHTAADWAAHIPSSTILLALALHTPGALS